MQPHRHRRRVDTPKPEHRLPWLSDPEKRHVPLRNRVREYQTNHVAIKADGAIEIGDGDVSLPQPLDWHDPHDVLSPLGIARTLPLMNSEVSTLPRWIAKVGVTTRIN